MTVKIERDLHGASRAVIKRLTKRLAKKKKTLESNQPQIPSPALFESLSTPPTSDTGSETRLPSITECAVHLEFLECLYTLRQRVLQSKELDAVCDIKENHRTVYRNKKPVLLKDPTLQERREVKWKIFVEWSVVRFLLWRRNLQRWCPQDGDDTNDSLFQFTKDTMPPLDVLMVLHTLLLNPYLFQRECGRGPLRALEFPWPILHSSINNSTWTYELNTSATSHFSTWLGMNPDLLSEMLTWRREASSNKTGKALLAFSHSEARAPFPVYPADWAPAAAPAAGRAAAAPAPALHVPAERALGAQLAAAVMRQCSFVDKMNERLWIRSPAVEGTLERARARYGRFLELMRLEPGVVLVPTLDVDLVWHTHQCAPGVYKKGTERLAGRFINHDDTVAQDRLDTGFDKTRELYLQKFGKEYRICGCWDCEALVSAIGASDGLEMLDEKTLKLVSEKVSYYKTVEVARRENLPLPDLKQWADGHEKK